MRAIFTWLDAHPVAFWLMAVAATGLCAWCLVQARSARIHSLALLALLVAWRWPALFGVEPLGPTEAGLLADALTLPASLSVATVDAVRDGSVAALALIPLNGLGLPLDYFTARGVALLMDWGSLCLIGAMLLRVWPATIARLGLLALALGVARIDFLQGYSALHPSTLALAIAAWLHWRTDPDPRPRTHGLVLGAILAGLPWINLAAGAAGLGVWLAGVAWARLEGQGAQPGTRTRCAWSGFVALYGLALVFAALHGTNRLAAVSVDYLLEGVMSPGVLVLAFGAGPVALGAGILGGKILSTKLPSTSATVGYLAGAAAAGWTVWAGTPAMIGRLADAWRHPRSALAERIHGLQRPGDSLAVLGEGARLHVETALPRAGARRQVRQSLEENKPEFIVAVRPVGENWPAVADLLELKYAPDQTAGPATLFVRRDRLLAWKLGRPGIAPLRLATMRDVTAFAKVSEDDAGRLFAHAPSRMRHAIPAGARELRGTFGFIPQAYEHPDKATDGAHFIVNVISRDGGVVRRFDRWLRPVQDPADQGEMALAINLRPGEADAVEFIVEAGGSPAYDWVYWGELRFEGLPAVGGITSNNRP